MTEPAPFDSPPRLENAEGDTRRIGVELEFAGLRPEAIVEAVTRSIGGHARRESAVAWELLDTGAGDLHLELDFRLLQNLAAEGSEARGTGLPDWVSDLTDWTTELAERMASTLVPWEIVTAPMPMDRMHQLEPMIHGLRRSGALGTRHAPHFAFGVHLNPELPALDAATVLGYFRAYLCLNDWLRQRCRPDLLRVVTPYIVDFDKRWVREVLAPDYCPELDTFIDDYLDANPTRNRSLDMLPLFAYVDEERVRSRLDDPLIKGRPTLHYRLPNCEIDDPNWSLRPLWDDWLEVERLAVDEDRLARMCRAYRDWLGRLRMPFDDGWARASADWVSMNSCPA